ncbi:MAG TPA: hypothetical protein VHA55_13825 [Pseudorhodoplanes sp.]|jgi:hypothetical protein|nr:hypothetical protein [Pseudorhodoplanes sp.]
MSIVLLALGILTAGAGAVMVGFGVPINEFSLGNTLIISGTTALVGGLIVIALAVASRQLTAIALLLRAQPPARAARPVDEFEPANAPAHPPVARMPFPPRPAGEAGRDVTRPPESRFVPPEAPADPIFERLRMGQQQPMHRGAETPVLPDEDAPLSPRAPRIPPFPAEPAMPAEAQPAARPSEFRLPQRPAAAPGAPDRSRNGAAAQSARPSFEEAWPEPGASRAEMTEASPRGVESRSNGEAVRSTLAREAERMPVSILKSGVVDGMAYTLYTDGSIEAELAQGVVRFGSIEELRNHLEKGG